MSDSLKIMSWIPDLRAGGAETSLLLELKQLRSRGFEVSVGMISHDATLVPLYEAADIPVHTLGNGNRLQRFGVLWRTLRQERPDVVEVILFWPNIVVRPLARLLGIKVVTQLANEEYGAVQRAQSRYGAAGVIGAQIADLVTSRFAHRFRAVAKGVGTTMHAKLLIPTSKIAVIHIARELDALGRRTPERQQAARRTLGIDDDAFVVLCTGRQDAQKNQATAIQALTQLEGLSRKTVLLIAGREGQRSEQLQGLLRQLNGRVDVRLLGERDDVPELLCAADCFLMPSLWEGFSGAVVEAMALEIPLVLSNISSMREVTEDNAWFFEPHDVASCARLLVHVGNGEYPSDLIARNRSRAENELDIAKITSDLETLYRGLLA